ncbi:MAG: DUF1549 domain-containing protein [Planctomycetota bacterium]|nr:DUF1549 domain-containing protein [Planctomycetota bacterium]
MKSLWLPKPKLPGGSSAIALLVCMLLFSGSSHAQSTPSVTFEADIQPLLTRFGCNSGPCHGKSRGQNGFALSLLGFDSDFDYAALIREGRGRRVQVESPNNSLLLRKPTGQMPHGGGKKLEANGPHYKMIEEWIRSGAPRTPANAPRIVKVISEPPNHSLKPGSSIGLKVVAIYSDGTRRDVTDGSAFSSNENTVATVGGNGVVKAGVLPGEAAIMARYMNHITVTGITIPLAGTPSETAYSVLASGHPIDGHVRDKLKVLGITPSQLASETTWLRRAYVRLIGTLPTPEEVRTFLADKSPDKHAKTLDQLLERPEYADFWANKWADLLRPNPFRAGIKATRSIDAWLREAFRSNVPYDQFVTSLVTAQGSSWRNGAAVLFRDRPEPVEIASSVSQLFLGVRLECAKCHHHPFEVWSQDDFYGFAAFFSRIGRKGQGLSPPISGGEESIFTRDSGTLLHGRTLEPVGIKLLAGPAVTVAAGDDPRVPLAAWMTDPKNPWFARVMVNRVWRELMGQGIVEPVDDIRATNPATNAALLDQLADQFRRDGYDIKKLIRFITTSRTFALGSTPNDRNAGDLRNFSRYYRERFRAETLLDAVNDILDVEETFSAMPPGSRAVELWTYRASSLFLDTYGRPDPNQDPPCERTSDSTTPQVLHLMNSPALNGKFSLDKARPARLAASKETNAAIVDTAYLLIYGRLPSAAEAKTALAAFPTDGKNRRMAVEDLFWALLNTPEFVFID